MPTPSSRIELLALLPALLCSPSLSAQEPQPDAPTVLPKVPVAVTSGTRPSGTPEAPRPGTDRGEPRLVPLALDDVLPRSGELVVAAGADGDTVVSDGRSDVAFLGFSAGPYAIPEAEIVDPRLLERLGSPPGDARPHGSVYAFAVFGKRITPERILELEARGVRFLGYHPHNAMKIAIDASGLAGLLAHDAVRWVGLAQPWQKVHSDLAVRASRAMSGELFDVAINVFESDLGPQSIEESIGATVAGRAGQETRVEGGVSRWQARGWQESALRDLGIEACSYVPSIHAFRARVTAEQIAALVQRDFVQFVERVPEVTTAHDNSTPLVSSDFVRATYDGGWSGEAIAGQIDTGLDWSHFALNHAYYVGWSQDGSHPFQVTAGHGTHVGGTILGQPPAANDQFRGNAPGLGGSLSRAFRNFKVQTDADGDWTGYSCSSIDSWFSTMRNSWTDGVTTAPKPHVINNSWGSCSGMPSGDGDCTGGDKAWVGSESCSRQVDEEVWNGNQVYVFAAHNHGPNTGTVSMEGSAKNALTVGNVVPYNSDSVGLPGNVWGNSSRGPTGDGRWKPNIAAPGVRIWSATANTNDDYFAGTGTSMASPHVTGIVAQMVDRHSFLRYQPARIASLVMATASTKDDVALTGPGDAHLDDYGAGRIEAYRANYTDSQHGWLNWGWTQSQSVGAEDEFVVPSGCTRIVVAMHYIEPAASSGASKALINDFDLYIDRPPLTAGTNTGEYTAQQSSVNNTEIRTIENPPAGTWKWKVHPDSATGSVKASVTVHFVHGDTSPDCSLTVAADDVFVKPGEDVTITSTVGNTETMASAVFTEVLSSSGGTRRDVSFTLLDGPETDFSQNMNPDGSSKSGDQSEPGTEVTLGNIRHGWEREVAWTYDWAGEGLKTFSVRALNDQGWQVQDSVVVTVDGTPPNKAFNLHSTSHTIGQWSNDAQLDFAWLPASDALSGIDGYGLFLTSSQAMPGTTKDIGNVSSTSQNATTSAQGWYFNLRSLDKCGNWDDDYSSTGPYFIDTIDPSTVSGFVSTSHLTGTWSKDTSIDFQWVAATDVHSGVDGYGVFLSNGSPNAPSNVKDIGAVTSHTEVVASASFARYLNLRTVDEAGNWDDEYASAGPFYVDAIAPTLAPELVVLFGDPTMTTSTNIIVEPNASDAHSGLDQFRLRNDGGAWSAWMPYAQSIFSSLLSNGGSSATGTRNVDIEVRDLAGNVAGATASIYYYVPAQTFGASCNGSLGAPTIAMNGIAKLGGGVQFEVGNTAAAVKRLVLGFSKSSYLGLPLPLDLGLVGSPGCTLNVSADFTLQSGAASTCNVSVPNDATLADVNVYLQWLLLGDPSGKLVIGTQGLDVNLNGI